MNSFREITLKDFLKERSMTLQDLASELGLSISLLSKIKNGVEPISKNTSDIFINIIRTISLLVVRKSGRFFLSMRKKRI